MRACCAIARTSLRALARRPGLCGGGSRAPTEQAPRPRATRPSESSGAGATSAQRTRSSPSVICAAAAAADDHVSGSIHCARSERRPTAGRVGGGGARGWRDRALASSLTKRKANARQTSALPTSRLASSLTCGTSLSASAPPLLRWRQVERGRKHHYSYLVAPVRQRRRRRR